MSTTLIRRATATMTRRSLLKSAGLTALSALVSSPVFKALVEAAPDDPGAAAKRLASETVVIGQDIARGVSTTVRMMYDKAKDEWTMLEVAHEAIKHKIIEHTELEVPIVDGPPGMGHAWDRVAKKTGATLEEVKRVAHDVLEGATAVRAEDGWCMRNGGHVPPHEGFIQETEFPPQGPLLCINCGLEIGPCENGSPLPKYDRQRA